MANTELVHGDTRQAVAVSSSSTAYDSTAYEPHANPATVEWLLGLVAVARQAGSAGLDGPETWSRRQRWTFGRPLSSRELAVRELLSKGVPAQLSRPFEAALVLETPAPAPSDATQIDAVLVEQVELEDVEPEVVPVAPMAIEPVPIEAVVVERQVTAPDTVGPPRVEPAKARDEAHSGSHSALLARIDAYTGS